MPVLILFRKKVLLPEEISRLPMGCFPISEEDERFRMYQMVAQAQIRAPMAVLLKMAFEMGKAFPDARFGFEEGFAHQEAEYNQEESAQESQRSEEIDSVEDEEKGSIEEPIFSDSSEEVVSEEVEDSSEEELLAWHELVEKGLYDEAMEALEQVLPVSQEDQIILSRLFSSQDVDKMLFVCTASIRFQWKSMALKLRSGLRHADARVRALVVRAIGVLAGPSLSPVVHIMSNDPDENVRKEAAKALQRMKKR